MIRHRTVAALLAMMLATTVVGGLLNSPPVSAAAADPAPPDSAVTVSGRGDFANLKVTVSQTKNLINQTVRVSWTGGTPTPSTGFTLNFLQIMQCWGDDPAGPDRTQCQFGGLTALGSATTVGPFVLSRQIEDGDPEETLKQPAGSSSQVYVPFWAVGTDKPTGSGTGNTNDFFDSQVTNEIPVARTHGDGTGEEFFEVETVRQAAGLGCGEPVVTSGSTTGRSCWLVIVPRGNKEVNGSILTGANGQASYLETSPLSQSNWDQRIVVPLGFQPVGQACPIGAPERSLLGHELAIEAVSSWQPALCAGGGALFSYTQLPDDVARSQAQDARLALVTNPIPPDQVRADHPLVYAPVGLSGLTFAFNIDHQVFDNNAPAADLALNGQRFTSMKLTPLLVAKLLTQSYRYSLVPYEDALKNNPIGLLSDPEFLDLNPEYKGFTSVEQSVPDALVLLNGGDVTSLLWSWVIADPDARAFLAGNPDKFGMVVNPSNKNLPLPTSTFPRNDQGCTTSKDDSGNPATTCNLDVHPYANDMHDAARSASRGDSLARQNTFDTTLHQQVSTKIARQFIGFQGLLAVVDAATAARYDLPTAQLLNAAGNYVAPTPESLLAGEAAMKPSAVAGVLASAPRASDPAAYPLTALSYAVTAPATLDAAAGKDYAAFLRYAAGPGQQQGLDPGQLPLGMVPLPDPLKAQTIAAATTIETQTSKSPTSPTGPPPITGITGTTGTNQALIGGTNTPAGTNGTATNPGGGRPAATLPGAVAPASGPPTQVPSLAQQPVVRGRRTPSLPAPAVGALLLVILIAGALAATSSPVIQLFGGGRLRHRRKEVTPTEQ
ncbi:MAG: hypothetical protein WCB73_06295 [Pseudonocardiaceae bacterium]